MHPKPQTSNCKPSSLNLEAQPQVKASATHSVAGAATQQAAPSGLQTPGGAACGGAVAQRLARVRQVLNSPRSSSGQKEDVCSAEQMLPQVRLSQHTYTPSGI